MQRQKPPPNLLTATTGTALLTIPPADPGGRLLRTGLGACDGGIPFLVLNELVQLGRGAVVVAFRFGVGVVVVGGGWLEGGGGRREGRVGVGIGGGGTILGLGSSGVVGGGIGGIGAAEPGEHVFSTFDRQGVETKKVISREAKLESVESGFVFFSLFDGNRPIRSFYRCNCTIRLALAGCFSSFLAARKSFGATFLRRGVK